MSRADSKIQDADGTLVGLALAARVALLDGGPAGEQLGYVRGWALRGVDVARLSAGSKTRFERSFRRCLAQIGRLGQQLDIEWLCSGLGQGCPEAVRSGILRLCVVVATADGRLTKAELELLRRICSALGLELDRLGQAIQQLVQVDLLDVRDPEVLFGVTPSMESRQALDRLNRQYAMWNWRANSTDRDLRLQAERMLDLIAQVRLAYSCEG